MVSPSQLSPMKVKQAFYEDASSGHGFRAIELAANPAATERLPEQSRTREWLPFPQTQICLYGHSTV